MAESPGKKPKSERPRGQVAASRPQAIVSAAMAIRLDKQADDLQVLLKATSDDDGETLKRGRMLGYLCYWFMELDETRQKRIILDGRVLSRSEGLNKRVSPTQTRERNPDAMPTTVITDIPAPSPQRKAAPKRKGPKSK